MTRRSRLAFAFALLAGLICARLGFWQLSRCESAERATRGSWRAGNSLDRPRPGAPTVLRSIGWSSQREFDFNTEFVIRRQSMEGACGTVVTPATGGGTHGAGYSGYRAFTRCEQRGLDSLRSRGLNGSKEWPRLARSPEAGSPWKRGANRLGTVDLGAIRKAPPIPSAAGDPATPRLAPARLSSSYRTRFLDDGHLSYAVQSVWFAWLLR
jgi:hypothetical protein